MNVLDHLAVHAGIDHAVGEEDNIVVITLRALVAAAVRLGPTVDADQVHVVLAGLGSLELYPLAAQVAHPLHLHKVLVVLREEGALLSSQLALRERLVHLEVVVLGVGFRGPAGDEVVVPRVGVRGPA
eukprot:7130428-Heterocapsa_arctica.AAC.1